MVIAMIKPGFHMIALIAAIAEKKNIHRSCGNHSPAIAETTIADIELLISQRLLSLRSLRSLESGYMITMIAAIAEVFFFSAIAAITAMVAII